MSFSRGRRACSTRLRKLRELTDVNSDQQNKGLEARLVIDRATASRLGITPQLIDNTLYDAFGQRQVSTMYTQLNQYHVVMEVESQFWQNPDGLKYIYVRSSTGDLVPLAAFTRYEPSTAPLDGQSSGQFPSVTISFNLPAGVALGTAVDAINRAETEIRLAGVDPRKLPGNGPGVSGIDRRRADLDRGGVAGRLHRSWGFSTRA